MTTCVFLLRFLEGAVWCFSAENQPGFIKVFTGSAWFNAPSGCQVGLIFTRWKQPFLTLDLANVEVLNCRCCFRTRAKCYLSNRFVRERRTLCHFSWGARPIIPILSFYQVINLAVADTCSCFLNLKSSHFTLLLCEKIKRLTWAERLFYTLLPSVVNYISPMALKGHTKKKEKHFFV